jgi:hypothetical protein
MKELVKKAAECQEDSLDCITKANLDVPKICNREKEKKPTAYTHVTWA